jgi:subtilisin family serine protease
MKVKNVFKTVSIVLAILLVLTACQNALPHRAQWWFDAIECRYDVTAGQGLSIALIDSGIDVSHPDLKDCDIETIDLLAIGQDSDMQHGTAMAGVICAKPNDENGLIGIVPGVKIYDIRAVDSTGSCDNSVLVQAINIAIDKQVDLINISIGTKTASLELETAIRDAIESNIIVVAATSNAGSEEIIYPAAYAGVVKVIPVNKRGGYLYGLTIPEGERYIKAPGQSIVTTMGSADRLYGSFDGTSIATAITSGVIARAIYENPKAERNQLVSKLYEQNILCVSKIW